MIIGLVPTSVTSFPDKVRAFRFLVVSSGRRNAEASRQKSIYRAELLSKLGVSPSEMPV